MAIRVLREMFDETDEEDETSNNDAKNVPPAGRNGHALEKDDEKSDDEFDKEKTIARMRKTMDDVFNMDEETRKKTSPLPSKSPCAKIILLDYRK